MIEPEIQVFARVLGNYQWMCPNCTYMHTATHSHWRRSQLRCWHCNRSYRVGLWFDVVYIMPASHAYYMGPYNYRTVNRYREGVGGGGFPTHARAVGSTDWTCPACSHTQNSQIEWDRASLTCEKCSTTFYTKVLLWGSPKGQPIKTPIDCVPPLSWRPFVKESVHKSVSVTQDLQIAREDR